jgi:CRP-like cAMP-binding protein
MYNEPAFFDRLLLLPLFQGIARREFQDIANTISLGYRRVPRETVVVHQDEMCTGLHFILGGETRVACESSDHGYTLTEHHSHPMVVQPEALFGLTTRYTRTFRVMRGAEMLSVEKAAVRDLLFDYPTFRINYLNMVSARMQLATRHLWRSLSPSLPARFAQFLEVRSLRPAGYKELHIMRPRLAEELHDTPRHVAEMLAALRDDGLVTLTRGYVIVPNFEKLLLAVRK